jgi:hypothetical protein
MATSQSSALWSGDLKNGRGTMRIGDNVYEGAYSFAPRFMDGDGLNPEELLAGPTLAVTLWRSRNCCPRRTTGPGVLKPQPVSI